MAGARQSTRQPGLVALDVSHWLQATVSELLATLPHLLDATLQSLLTDGALGYTIPGLLVKRIIFDFQISNLL